jgi:hypothetical protein
VTRAGGSAAAADALYARLDRDNAGSVSAERFISLLSQARAHRRHHQGNGVQDALAALLDHLFPSDASATTAGERSASAATAVTAIPGETAADALWALLNTAASNDGGASRAGMSANSLQDALLTLLSGNFGLSGRATADPLRSLLGMDFGLDFGLGSGTGMGFGAGMGWGTGGNFGLWGNAAADPLRALLGLDTGFGLGTGLGLGTGASGSIFDMSGMRGTSALLALLQATGTASSNRSGGWPSLSASSLDLPSAIKLYQHNLNAQMFDAMFARD